MENADGALGRAFASSSSESSIYEFFRLVTCAVFWLSMVLGMTEWLRCGEAGDVENAEAVWRLTLGWVIL